MIMPAKKRHCRNQKANRAGAEHERAGQISYDKIGVSCAIAQNYGEHNHRDTKTAEQIWGYLLHTGSLLITACCDYRERTQICKSLACGKRVGISFFEMTEMVYRAKEISARHSKDLQRTFRTF